MSAGKSFFDPQVIANPFSFYQQMRHHAPVYFEENIHFWLISRHADVLSLLRHKGVCSKNPPIRPMRPLSPETAGQQSAVRQMVDNWGSFQDGPEHKAFRSIMGQGFIPNLMKGMRPRVRDIVNSLLDNVSAKGHMDVAADFAYPLALNVIGEIMGVPRDSLPLVKDWAGKIITYFNDVSYSDPDAIADMDSVRLEMSAFIRELVQQRRVEPRNDVLTAMVNALNDDTFDEEKLVSNCILLLFAGHETTVNLIGNGVKALCENPDQYARLQNDHDLIPAAVEEFVRYESPAQYTGRFTTEEIQVGGVTIGAGQGLMLLLGSANRDELVFEDAHKLDVGRSHNPHLGFGQGAHYCMGAPLARIEAQETFKGLLERCPHMTLTDTPRLRFSPALRGYSTIPITWKGTEKKSSETGNSTITLV